MDLVYTYYHVVDIEKSIPVPVRSMYVRIVVKVKVKTNKLWKLTHFSPQFLSVFYSMSPFGAYDSSSI